MRRVPSRYAIALLTSTVMLLGLTTTGSATASELSPAAVKASVSSEAAPGWWCRWWLAPPVDSETSVDNISHLPPSCWW